MRQREPVIVTIDGPAASGKSSVSREIARQHGWNWVSTGAFYRGLAYVARRLKVPLDDEKALAELAVSDRWRVEMTDARTGVFLGNEDVTDQIYKEQVGTDASLISNYPKVRQSLLQAQRDCAEGVSGLVAEGRDCGTVVFPRAQVKIYLTAASEHRAARRAMEEGRSVDETKAAQRQRDHQDSTRQVAPLQIPKSAHVVDTTDMELGQVVAHISRILKSEGF